jgi:hypothetical protein
MVVQHGRAGCNAYRHSNNPLGVLFFLPLCSCIFVLSLLRLLFTTTRYVLRSRLATYTCINTLSLAAQYTEDVPSLLPSVSQPPSLVWPLPQLRSGIIYLFIRVYYYQKRALEAHNGPRCTHGIVTGVKSTVGKTAGRFDHLCDRGVICAHFTASTRRRHIKAAREDVMSLSNKIMKKVWEKKRGKSRKMCIPLPSPPGLAPSRFCSFSRHF